jgi:hypothetical protein
MYILCMYINNIFFTQPLLLKCFYKRLNTAKVERFTIPGKAAVSACSCLTYCGGRYPIARILPASVVIVLRSGPSAVPWDTSVQNLRDALHLTSSLDVRLICTIVTASGLRK